MPKLRNDFLKRLGDHLIELGTCVATLASGKQVLRTRHSTAVAQVLKGLRDWLSSL